MLELMVCLLCASILVSGFLAVRLGSLMAAMVSGLVDPAVMFMLGTAAALVINYADCELQRARIDAHAKAAVMMAAILLAAGAFTGIMTGSGMLTAMATSVA